MHFKKNIITKMLTGFCTALTFVFLASPATLSAAEELNFMTNDRVNFRAEPSLEADIYQTLNFGTTVDVINHDPDPEGWSLVMINGQDGYIKSEFLSEKPAPVSYSSGEHAGGVELLHWSEVQDIFTLYTPVEVYDVWSGVTYYIQSFSNGRHADVETLTQNDTNLLLQTYGGSWDWDPRPVWVTINGRTIAASINGMPHGGGTISGNGLNGQVCLHFLGSSTHNGNGAFTQDHQDAVMIAWNAQ